MACEAGGRGLSYSMRNTLSSLAFATVLAALPGPSSAQSPAPPPPGERVTYQNPVDGTTLSARLFVPAGEGPFPGVVLLTLAGADDLVSSLTRLGWAVLYPVRRGMGTPEHFLQASFQNLSDDVRGATEYLRSRPEVDEEVVGLMAQGGRVWRGF